MNRAESLLEFALNSSCRTCGRPVVWAAFMKKGGTSGTFTTVGIEPTPTLRGQLVLYRGEEGPLLVRRATQAELEEGGRTFWNPHQCPTYTPPRRRAA